MTKTLRNSLIFCTAIVIAIGTIKFMQYREYSNYKARIEALIHKIDSFNVANNKLPESLRDINIEESMCEGPYYNKVDSNEYEIYFSFGFDEYMIYNSKNKAIKSKK